MLGWPWNGWKAQGGVPGHLERIKQRQGGHALRLPWTTSTLLHGSGTNPAHRSAHERDLPSGDSDELDAQVCKAAATAAGLPQPEGAPRRWAGCAPPSTTPCPSRRRGKARATSFGSSIGNVEKGRSAVCIAYKSLNEIAPVMAMRHLDPGPVSGEQGGDLPMQRLDAFRCQPTCHGFDSPG